MRTFFRHMNTVSIVVSIFVVGFISGCGGGGGGSSPSTANPANTYSISGTVTGAASVAVSLTGAATATTTGAGGSYSFTGLSNGSYTVKPAKVGYVFSPISLAANMSGANITGKNFTATASTVVTYTLSGKVSGAVVQGVTITLNGANTGSVVTDANGNYSFSGLVSGNYTVTPSLAGYAFTTSSTIVIGLVNPPSNNFTSTVTPSGSKVVFVPLNPLPPATVGAAYSNTVISIPASGGTAPYHYQSDSFATGAPPIGMLVDLNGKLTGTPRVAGTYTFGVCAVDLGGSSSCKTTSIIVNPSTAAANDGPWNLQVAISTCYVFTQTTPITITNGTFSGHLFQYCSNAKTGATWLGGSGCGALVGQYWIGTEDVSVDLTVTGNNIAGNLTLTGSPCTGSDGFYGSFDTAIHGTAGANTGTLTFSK